jgi:[NiFe] hydrogenase diaphorase moiety small subunit
MVMSETIKFTIDGKEVVAKNGQNIIDAARENGIYIPSLCHITGVKAAGSCRICNVKVNGKFMTACTTPVGEGMLVENDTSEVNELRKSIVEVLFVEGNHYCPFCEKSGNCELQALGYRFNMMVPRFPYQFPVKEVDANSTLIYHDKNRCIACKRCVRSIKKDGKNVFAFRERGHKLSVSIDNELASLLSEQEALEAMEICPVGAIIKKEIGFKIPIGQRKFDTQPIGSDIENKQN